MGQLSLDEVATLAAALLLLSGVLRWLHASQKPGRADRHFGLLLPVAHVSSEETARSVVNLLASNDIHCTPVYQQKRKCYAVLVFPSDQRKAANILLSAVWKQE